jgi:hypothetical protein
MATTVNDVGIQQHNWVCHMVKQNLYLDKNISMTVYVYIDKKKMLHVLNCIMPFTYLEVVNGADCGRYAYFLMLLFSSLP